MDEATRAIIRVGGSLIGILLGFGLITLLFRLRERNMNVGEFIKSIFMDPKQRRAQRLVAGLSVQLSKLYENAVREAELQLDLNRVVIQGTGRDLAVNLSPKGVDKLIDDLPPSIASLLDAEGIEVRKRALELLMTFENYRTIDGLWLHPIVRGVMKELLEGTAGKGQ